MRIRFHPLFKMHLQAGFVPLTERYDGLEWIPCTSCEALMGRYALKHRKLASGLQLYYQTQPVDHSIIPLRPMLQEEVFRFFLTISDASFGALADIRGWKADHIYIIKNAVYNTTGDIVLVNGPLQNPVQFRPLVWKHEVSLRVLPWVLRVRNEAGVLIATHPVRALGPLDAPGTIDAILIDLSRFGEGEYTIEQVYPGAPPPVSFFCSPDYRPGVFAVVNIRYRYGALYTGLFPIQSFVIRLQARSADWFYKVFISTSNRTMYPADQLTLIHRPAPGELPVTFSLDGLPDNAQGTVTFRSDAAIPFPAKPFHIDLVKQPNAIVVPRLPMPNAGQMVLQAGQLASSIIINI